MKKNERQQLKISITEREEVGGYGLWTCKYVAESSPLPNM
jgi:hypothetical protein